MNQPFYWSRLCVLAGLLSVGTPPIGAHDFLTGYVQHRVELTVGAKHIDVTLRLTFFEDGSEHERRHMDSNNDGRLSRAEVQSYAEEVELTSEKNVKLEIDGRPVSLITLYPPDVDLLGESRVGRERHVLTLHLFARTPAELGAGAEVRIQDELWPELRAIPSLHVAGRDGSRLEPNRTIHGVLADGKEAILFAARVLKPPVPATSSTSAPGKP